MSYFLRILPYLHHLHCTDSTQLNSTRTRELSVSQHAPLNSPTVSIQHWTIYTGPSAYPTSYYGLTCLINHEAQCRQQDNSQTLQEICILLLQAFVMYLNS